MTDETDLKVTGQSLFCFFVAIFVHSLKKDTSESCYITVETFLR